MIGRDDARRQLEGVAAAARSGEPALVLVSGEAGIGKTRLIAEAMGQVDGECVAVTGGGVDLLGGEIPLILLSSSVRSLVQRYGLDAVRGWAGGDVSRLAVLVRDLAPEAPAAHEPLELIEAFRAMLARLSSTRFVWWAIEDVQWADPSSLDAVRFVVQLMQAPERLLVTCTLRTRDRSAQGLTGSFVSELVRAPATVRIRLRRLDLEQVGVQIGTLLEGPVSNQLVERVMFLSDGVPFLVEELVAAGLTESGPLPASATELMVSRAAALGADAEAVVRAASVAPEHLHDRWLAPVTGLSATSLEQAVRTLVEGGVLEVDDSGERYRFHHALMREGIAAAMLPSERRRWHRTWAQALSTVALDQHDASTMVEIAEHWMQSGESDPAFASSLAAARSAELVGSQHARAAMLCEALRLWPQVGASVRDGYDHDGLIEQAIWACALGGRPELGVQLLADLVKSPDTSGDGELRRLRLTLAKERFELSLGREEPAQGRHRFEERVGLLRRSPRTLVFAHAVSDLLANAPDPESSRLLDDLIGDATQVVTEQGTFFDRVDLQDSRSHHVKVLGRLDEAANLVLEILREHGDHLMLTDLMRVESNAVSHLYDAGRPIEGRAIGRRAAQRLSDPRLCPEPWTSLAENLAATLIETGDWAEAQSYLDEIEALGVDTPAVSIAALTAVVLECRRGDLTAAEQRLASLREREGARATPPHSAVRHTLVAAEVALSSGDGHAAWTLLAPIWAVNGSHDLVLTRNAQLLAARALGAARFKGGSSRWPEPIDERVRDLRDAAAQLPQSVWPTPWRHRLELALARTVGDDTHGQWEHCVVESERLGQPYEQGLALLGMAHRALADHESSVAHDALQRAQTLAASLGSRTLMAWIREASARGRIPLNEVSVGSTETMKRHGLTGRELEVLRLLAEGYSNDEIAAELFISPKTASVHVSHILSKLGVKSRGAASALAHREGLFTARQ